ncbi:MAG: hypothetical protein HY296_04655 [Thaumarchaeota archaeon]|nr:hypothetical protein [Nitrososphaerota archaeon]
MLGFTESFVAWLASTAAPAFIGLTAIAWAGRFVRPRYLTAFAFGIFLWFFVDTIGGSANLYVDLGLTGGADQLAVFTLFVIGFVLLFAADNEMFASETAQSLGLRVPLLVAIAVSVHGFGEGTAFGSTAAKTSSASLLDAFGGTDAGVAYVLHKLLEPTMIGACYVAYRQTKGTKNAFWLKDITVLALLFTIPSLIGAATGYFISYNATYFFALGTGTSIYAALRLVRPLYGGSDPPAPYGSLKVGVWFALGFTCIYLAALFHS